MNIVLRYTTSPTMHLSELAATTSAVKVPEQAVRTNAYH